MIVLSVSIFTNFSAGYNLSKTINPTEKVKIEKAHHSELSFCYWYEKVNKCILIFGIVVQVLVKPCFLR